MPPDPTTLFNQEARLYIPSDSHEFSLIFISAWVGSLYISLAYMFGPLVTRFIEWFGLRHTASCGALLLSISFIASSFADKFWLFFLLFSIPTGLGSAASYHCSILVVLKHFVKWRSLVVGIIASTSSVGMFVMTQITEALLSKYGLQNAIRGWALLFFVTVPLTCIYDSRDNVEDNNVSTREENTNNLPERIHLSLFRNGSFMVYIISLSLVFFAVFTPQIYMVRLYPKMVFLARGNESHRVFSRLLAVSVFL